VAAGNKKVVLIVDDEFDARRTIELLFGLEGYEVITAQNGEVALEKIAERKPHIIVTDWMMPVMDGYELCARMRANPETKSIPIIMLTAVVSTVLAKEKLWNVLVAKPAYFEELLALVNDLTSQSQ
jgi:DNA-binding response OmpR family regulator